MNNWKNLSISRIIISFFVLFFCFLLSLDVISIQITLYLIILLTFQYYKYLFHTYYQGQHKNNAYNDLKNHTCEYDIS